MEFIVICLTSIFSYLSLFLLTKLMGHKQISQLDFFDYITGITIGSIAAEFATELEAPWKPLLAMVIYAIGTLLLGFDLNWLSKQLHQHGIRSHQDVFLAVCDKNQNISFYKKEDK